MTVETKSKKLKWYFSSQVIEYANKLCIYSLSLHNFVLMKPLTGETFTTKVYNICAFRSLWVFFLTYIDTYIYLHIYIYTRFQNVTINLKIYKYDLSSF